jgi:2-furoyl-CoA dehydrogenase 2Fe-2S iron sulfur subunit
VTVVLNGRTRHGECEPRTLLSDFIRHELGATGTHVGCEHGVCGACTVRVDGVAARSCLMFAVQADGRCIDTVEGLAPSGILNDLQEAFRRHHALQCGFCTAGILMSCADYLDRVNDPDEAEVRAMLSGHLCRCTGYAPIVAAVLDVARERRARHSRCEDGQAKGEAAHA